MASNVVIKIRDLKKRYGENVVLKGINIDIHAGEVVVLIGPSGSGKSTLLRCMNDLEHMDSGTIAYDVATLSAGEKKEF
jgi:ABC-type polar amino acid transport system ATPase subunit